MAEAPVFQLADPNREYIVTFEASNFVVGVVLSQGQDDSKHPMVFESRKMNELECNCPAPERKLLAVIHALRI